MEIDSTKHLPTNTIFDTTLHIQIIVYKEQKNNQIETFILELSV